LSGLYTGDELAEADGDADPVVNIALDHANSQPNQEAPARPSPFQEMIKQFADLKARLAPDEAIYYEVLSEFGVCHANEFKDLGKARMAYRRLLEKVREYEATQQLAEESAMIDAAAMIEEPDQEAIP
jgi:hypothetical protein